MQKERKRIREAFLSLLELMGGEVPQDYLDIFYHQYEGEGESWLDLFPLVFGYNESQKEEVVDFLSYLNPKFFPPREDISSINFSELSGGKGRRCTKGIYTESNNHAAKENS